MRKFLLFIFSIAFFRAEAQDLHFSQFWSAPLNINPALAGMNNRDVRVILNYRTQWAAVSAEPYKTLGASADMMIPPRKDNKGFWAFGINCNSDKAGVGNLKTTQGNVTLAYHKMLSRNTSMLSMGVQFGGGSRSVDYASFSWDAQYNGKAYIPALPSKESPTPGLSSSFSDLSAGMLFSMNPSKYFRMNAGVSLYHLNRPELQFSGGNDPQSMRFTFHTSAQIASATFQKTSFVPAVLFSQQGPQQLINAGIGILYSLQEKSQYTGFKSESSLYFGAFFRMRDAAYLVTRVNFGDFAVGISYDLSVTGITTASNGRGGLEMMLMFNKSLFGSAKTNPKGSMRLVNL
jgi:type IX secretion system PorP/SprF family membrane protein